MSQVKLAWAPKHEFIQLLADGLYRRDTNPSREVKIGLAKALVQKYPYLQNRIGAPHAAWVEKLNNALKGKRQADPGVQVRKRKREAKDTSFEPEVKRAETGWQPELPREDGALLFQQKEMMRRESTKKEKNKEKIKDLMDAT